MGQQVKAGTHGSSGLKSTRRASSLLAILALALCVLGSGAPAALADPPAVTMGTASDAAYGSVHATGEVNGGGFSFWSFEYSTDASNWTQYNFDFAGGSTLEPVQADISGLKGGTHYFVRLAATNFGETVVSPGPYPEFTTLPVDPPSVLVADEATDVFSTTAGASGQVERPADPDPLLDAHPAFDVNCNFEYVSDDQFNATGFDGAAQAPCEPQNPLEAAGASAVTGKLSGLTPSTTYHLRLSGGNAGGFDSKEAAGTFTTAAQVGAPSALGVDDASDVAYTTARLTGKVERPTGADPALDVTCRFEYITAAQFDQNENSGAPAFEGANQVPCDPERILSDGSTEVAAAISGLAVGTEYRQRLVVENGGGTDSAEGSSFITSTPSAPTVTVDPASAVTGTGASFSGKVTVAGIDAAFNSECFFDYVPEARDERQRLAVTATGGTYKLKLDAAETTPIASAASAAEVLAALEGLPAIGAGNVSVSGGKGIHPYVIVFVGTLADTDMVELATVTTRDIGSGNTAPTLFGTAVVTTSVQGSDGTFAAAPPAPCDPNPVLGTDPVQAVDVQAAVADLEPKTTYHLRLRAVNQGGVGLALAPDFSTDALPPAILDTAVADVQLTGATLQAEIAPNGDPTTYRFEYLTDADYKAASGSFAGAVSTAESNLPAADNEGQAAEAPVSGLLPGTVYRYRVVATNTRAPAGVPSPPRSFRTRANPVAETETCPNKAIREQQGATDLPECRAYEIVNSPALDSGEANRVPSMSDDGKTVVYSSVIPGADARGGGLSSFSVARRGTDGWTRENADPFGYGPVPGLGLGMTTFLAASTDYTEILVLTPLPLSPDDHDSQEDYYRVDVATGNSTLMTQDVISQPFGLLGVDPSLGRIVYQVVGNVNEIGIFDSDGTSTELRSLDENGDPLSFPVRAGTGADRGIEIGVGTSGASRPFLERGGGMHAVSEDAGRVYFYGGKSDAGPLYLNDHGTTIRISASQRAADLGVMHAGTFLAASHDGSIAYFASLAQLTDAATPGGGIYRFDLGTEKLTLLTPDAGPAGLKLSGPLVSDDLSHVYFVSTTALAPGSVDGKPNAYVWTEAHGFRFIAALPDGAAFQRVTPNGRYALLLSAASVEGAPGNGFTQVYRYDDHAEELVCVSCRPDGTPSQGAAQIEGQSFTIPNNPQSHSRALTFDGRVVFATADRLVAADQSSAQDVYIYDDGKVSLLSSGIEEADTFVFDVSDDGDHVLVTSRAAFVGSDRDAAEFDVYDIAVGGGFLEPTPQGACEGEACRGPASPSPDSVGPTTSNFIAPGNPTPCRKGKVRRNGRCVKRHPHRRKQAKKHKTQQRAAGKNRGAGR